MLSIGILGCGRIGNVHARTLKFLETARIAAVADVYEPAAASLSEKTGAPVRSIDEIMADTGIDAVVIGTSTDTHFDLIRQAAAAEKAIFCEKPVDLSVERIEICLEAVDKAGVPMMVAFNRRFDPGFAGLQRRLVAGEIGRPELITILSRDPGPPPIPYIKASGGIFRDMMIHDFDMARFLLGEEPTSVHAVGSCMVDPEIGAAGDVDTAAVTLTTASGAICQISNSRRATYGYDQRVEVHGSKGLLRVHNQPADMVETATGDGFASAPTMPFFLERYEEAYRREMVHFVESVNAGTAPSPSGHDGLMAQRLADAAARSLADGATEKP